ncbi:precorrin-6y C5,15-methyltransferase (decarboxylating) subunit CbiE [Paracoccaceae bacterium Fryx2]|nr:precorrin-6y C5,15-methyltransferase (decarboxylating) subunit CbiE [Paracoccaceae bacterium Fryx2]
MADPWLALIGIGEDGLAGLTGASLAALAAAEIVFGGPRHLELAGAGDRGRPWPVPFSIQPVLACRGQRVAVLASGDPFWFGAGGSLMADLQPGEWVSHPVPSTFSLAANRLGWRLEEVTCHGLHAAPFARLLPVLARDARILCLVRDGAAAGALAQWLTAQGFGASRLWLMESLGGPHERLRETTAAGFDAGDLCAPVAVAVQAAGARGLPRSCGLPDDAFAHDGQITKRAVRALTLSALAPRAGERLWDIGAGSGSVSVEWCLAGGHATAIEARGDRVANIRSNIAAFGLGHRMVVVEGAAPGALAGLPAPDAVFIGGGGDDALLTALWACLPTGVRLVANGVTLETEALLARWHGSRGGHLLRIDLAQAAPLGRMRGWTAARPVVQWSVET